MAYSGEWLGGYGLEPDEDHETISHGELLPVGSPESLISLELGTCLIHASRNLPYRIDAPLETPRGDSIVWLRKALLLPECVKHYRGWMKSADACESPVEAVAFLSLCAALSLAKMPLEVARAGETPKLPKLAERMVLAQVALQEPADDYRIDIAVHFNIRLGNKLYCRDLAVECDGLEYHSAPLQRAHDKAKDRRLSDMGFSVFRFDGANVWNNAARVNHEITSDILAFGRQLLAGSLPKPGSKARASAMKERSRSAAGYKRVDKRTF